MILVCLPVVSIELLRYVGTVNVAVDIGLKRWRFCGRGVSMMDRSVSFNL